MAAELERFMGSGLAIRPAGQTARALARLDHQTVVRSAQVQAEAFVQTIKCHEIDHVAREAMSGQALLQRWAGTLANGDPFVADDLKLFVDTARLGKAEVLADLVSSYCRESGR